VLKKGAVMPKKIAINGFGRIGRTFLRTIFDDIEAAEQLDVVAINIGPCVISDHLDHLFRYDSLMGVFSGSVELKGDILIINDRPIKIICLAEPEKTTWTKLNVEWVVDASGCFTTAEKARCHLLAGARKVLITAPAKDEDVTIVPGVNDHAYDATQHNIVSLGSCTTNCFAPIIKILSDGIGIKQGMMTTIHAYTNNQVLLDREHNDPRRARAAAINIIPTKTGATETIFKVLPELAGKLSASAIRVPVTKVSLLEFIFSPEKTATVKQINDLFHTASTGQLEDIVAYTEEPLVSSDFFNTPYSAIIDGQLTQAQNNLVRVAGWYDNEYGYGCRLRDFLLHN